MSRRKGVRRGFPLRCIKCSKRSNNGHQLRRTIAGDQRREVGLVCVGCGHSWISRHRDAIDQPMLNASERFALNDTLSARAR